MDGRLAHRDAAAYTQSSTQSKRTQTSMYWVGIEPTILAFEWAKTVHELDLVATVISVCIFMLINIAEDWAISMMDRLKYSAIANYSKWVEGKLGPDVMGGSCLLE